MKKQPEPFEFEVEPWELAQIEAAQQAFRIEYAKHKREQRLAIITNAVLCALAGLAAILFMAVL